MSRRRAQEATQQPRGEALRPKVRGYTGVRPKTPHGAPTKAQLSGKAHVLREQLDLARAALKTHHGYVAARDRVLRDQERDLAAAAQRVAALEREVSELRASPLVQVVPRERSRLPDDRRALGIKLRINDTGHIQRCAACGSRDPASPPVTSLHLHLGFYPPARGRDGRDYPDGRLGEVFVRLDRERRADVASAFADAWATAFSYALQHDTGPEWLLSKARYVRDDSGGIPYVWNEERERYERHPAIHSVTSVLDYLAAVIERVIAGKPATRLSADEEVARQATEVQCHAHCREE